MNKASSSSIAPAQMALRERFSALTAQSLLGAIAITFLAFAGSVLTGTVLDLLQSAKIFGAAAVIILFVGVWFYVEQYTAIKITEFQLGPKGRTNDDD